jgi:hypothetical protein
MQEERQRWTRVAATAAIAVGLAAGSYGVASAAGGSSSGSSSTGGSSAAAPAAPSARQPWGQQRGDETLLTGDTRSKVEQAALGRLAGASIERIETDADGHAAYEAHVIQQDGTPATVYLDESFDVVAVERR